MEIQEHEYFYLVRWDFKILLHFQLENFYYISEAVFAYRLDELVKQ